ncbi:MULTISPECIES: RES family NAD+ phosphorylase [Sphingomonas]|uniref:RES family NAD+ phosphorylase n=1 Tax=Sphingomonas paucimobilis TaxID=13689 RepID=A0A7Y2KM41_SPHPI|nr:RES family NAD+ phosphorylase [Sphingomonas paucimobilis]MCM3681427.1 RES family NAD+ phosphorylase [Sphingomonas paucimobilis]NNG56502.1 RES family NAD+ phosphorylase [Sphingomonas paucimobilis]
MTYPLRPLRCPLWRMLTIRYQREPWSGEGARLHGGRWNPRGVAALYLGADHATAIAEFYQGLAKPGTLAPYRLDATAIADLTDGQGGACDDRVTQAMAAPWKQIAEIEGNTPPSWALATKLIADGAQGALVPSAQNPGGTALVLWHWYRAGETGEGAKLELLDPDGALLSSH